MNQDLFGNAVVEKKQETHESRREAGLKVQILEFFHDHRFESFTQREIVARFAHRKAEQVIKLVNSLKKTGHIKTNGDTRGSGVEGYCLIFNPHRYK